MSTFDAEKAHRIMTGEDDVPADDRPKRRRPEIAEKPDPAPAPKRARKTLTPEEKEARRLAQEEAERQARQDAMTVAVPVSAMALGAVNGLIGEDYRELRMTGEQLQQGSALLAAVLVKWLPLESMGFWKEEIELGAWFGDHMMRAARQMRARKAREAFEAADAEAQKPDAPEWRPDT